MCGWIEERCPVCVLHRERGGRVEASRPEGISLQNGSLVCFHTILPLASFLNSLPPSFPSHQHNLQSASAFIPAAKLVQPAAVTVGRKAATSMKLDLPAVVAGLAPAAFLAAPAFAAGMDEWRDGWVKGWEGGGVEREMEEGMFVLRVLLFVCFL